MMRPSKPQGLGVGKNAGFHKAGDQRPLSDARRAMNSKRRTGSLRGALAKSHTATTWRAVRLLRRRLANSKTPRTMHASRDSRPARQLRQNRMTSVPLVPPN